jgi:hypothetical protein
MPDSGEIKPEKGYGFATGSFRSGLTNISNSAGTHSRDQAVNQIVANVAMIGGIVTGSAGGATGVITGAYYNIATAVGSNTPVSGGTKLTDARTFLSATFRGHSSSLIQALNYLDARVSDAEGVEIGDIDIDGGTDIGAALADADLFIVDDGAGGTNRKMAASRIITYVEAGIDALGATTFGGDVSLGDNNITNVGDINADSISVDAAGTGLNIDFSGGDTTKNLITLQDNIADALNVTEGSNSYLKFVTTNSSEEITLGAKLNAGSQVVAGTGFDIDGGTIDGVDINTSDITAGNGKMILTTGTGASYFSGKVARFGTTGSSNLEIAGFGAAGESAYFGLVVSGGMLQVVKRQTLN